MCELLIKRNNNLSQYSDNIVVFTSIGATTTSPIIDVSMRNMVSFTLTTAGHSSGSGTVSINVSNDGVNFITGVAFQDATSTASTTWVTSKAGSSNGTVGGFLPYCPWRYMTYTLTFATDGTYTVVHESEG